MENVKIGVFEFRVHELFNSSDRHKWGKDYNILRLAAKGRAFKVFSIPAEIDGEPNGDPCAWRLYFESIANKIVTIIPKDGKTLYATTDGNTGYNDWFMEMGIFCWVGPKTFKRTSQLPKPYTLFGEFKDSEIWMEDLEETDHYLIDVANKSDAANLFDGVIFVREAVFQETFNQSLERLKDDEVEYKNLMRLKDVMVWNGRLFSPGGECLKKGQVIRTKEISADFVFQAGNAKKELSYFGDKVYLGLDPQPGKLEAYAGKSILQNYPWVFNMGEGKDNGTNSIVYKWLEAGLAEKVDCLETSKMLESLDTVLLMRANREIEPDSIITNQRLMLGLLSQHKSPSCFPALQINVAEAGIDGMVDLHGINVHIKIPGAIYVQNMPASVMAFLGLAYDIPSGYCMWDETYKVIVVNDSDYLANRRNHGGQDLDDKLCAIFVKWLGRTAVFMHRNPSARDEFNVKKFIGIPPVELSGLVLPDVLPPTAVENDLNFGVLPTPPRSPKEVGERRIVELADVWKDMMTAGLNPGVVILAASLWDHCNPQTQGADGVWSSPRNPWLCQKEEVVDTSVQLRDPVGIQWILKQAQLMLENLIYKSKVDIDPRLFGKTANLWLVEEDYYRAEKYLESSGRFKDCWWTSFVKLCSEEQTRVKAVIRNTVMENRVRTNFLDLVKDPLITDTVVKVGIDRYQGICGAYGSLASKFRKVTKGREMITTEGYTEVARVVKERFGSLVKYLEDRGVGLPKHNALILMAHAAHNSKGRILPETKDMTDHILCRKEFFGMYLRMVVKHTELV